MLLRLFSAALVAVAALCAGCAHMNSTAMGAGAKAGTVCRDGAILAPNGLCTMQGGVNAGSPSASPSTAD